MENQDGKIRFTTTDMEIQITTTIDTGIRGGQNAAFTVGGKKFQEILRVLPDQSKITIDTKENKAQIKTNKSRFSLQTLPAQDFPQLSNQLENRKSSCRAKPSRNYPNYWRIAMKVSNLNSRNNRLRLLSPVSP